VNPARTYLKRLEALVTSTFCESEGKSLCGRAAWLRATGLSRRAFPIMACPCQRCETNRDACSMAPVRTSRGENMGTPCESGDRFWRGEGLARWDADRFGISTAMAPLSRRIRFWRCYDYLVDTAPREHARRAQCRDPSDDRRCCQSHGQTSYQTRWALSTVGQLIREATHCTGGGGSSGLTISRLLCRKDDHGCLWFAKDMVAGARAFTPRANSPVFKKIGRGIWPLRENLTSRNEQEAKTR